MTLWRLTNASCLHVLLLFLLLLPRCTTGRSVRNDTGPPEMGHHRRNPDDEYMYIHSERTNLERPEQPTRDWLPAWAHDFTNVLGLREGSLEDLLSGLEHEQRMRYENVRPQPIEVNWWYQPNNHYLSYWRKKHVATLLKFAYATSPDLMAQIYAANRTRLSNLPYLGTPRYRIMGYLASHAESRPPGSLLDQVLWVQSNWNIQTGHLISDVRLYQCVKVPLVKSVEEFLPPW